MKNNAFNQTPPLNILCYSWAKFGFSLLVFKTAAWNPRTPENRKTCETDVKGAGSKRKTMPFTRLRP